jgi:hypothetical protein
LIWKLSGACYAVRSLLCQQYWHAQINLFCLLSLLNDVVTP